MKALKIIYKKIKSLFMILKMYHPSLWLYTIVFQLIGTKFITIILLNGQKFVVRPNKMDIFVLNEVIFNKDYDYGIRNLDPESSIVIDIGAHIGSFSVRVSPLAKKVIVYEPEEENLSILRRNIELNKKNNIVVRPFGIAKNNGKYHLYVSSTNSGGNSLYQEFVDNKERQQLINCVRLRDEIKKYKINKIDLLKIDCEGAEFEILTSLAQADLRKIQSIILEYHDQTKNKSVLNNLKSFLNNKSYKINIIKKIDDETGILYAFKQL